MTESESPVIDLKSEQQKTDRRLRNLYVMGGVVLLMLAVAPVAMMHYISAENLHGLASDSEVFPILLLSAVLPMMLVRLGTLKKAVPARRKLYVICAILYTICVICAVAEVILQIVSPVSPSALAPEIRTTLATPLMKAALSGDIPAMQSLLDKGAQVNEKNTAGFTALDYAAQAIPPYFDKESIPAGSVQFLLEHGADVDAAGEGGMTPLMEACAKGDTKVADILVAHGADINKVSRYGWSPLSQSVLLQQEKSVAFLLAHGARVDTPVEGGHHNLLGIAKKKGNQTIVEMLVRAGAK